jgi:hypothetical protein
MEKNKKPIIKRTSLYDVKLTADKIPEGIAYNYLGVADALTTCVEKFSSENDLMFPDDIDWEDDDAAQVLAGVGDVVDHMFGITGKSTRVDELHTAMNLPIICALNAYVPALPRKAKIAIIGADRGQNISQCEKALGSCKLDASFWCVEPNFNARVQSALKKSLDGYDSAVYNGTLFDAVAGGFFQSPYTGQNIEFDLIIHNLGMHVLCASERDRQHYVQFISNYLKPIGKALITTIDIDAIMRSDTLSLQSPSRTMQILQVYPPNEHYCEGLAIVRIGATKFRDPILSMGAIGAMFCGTDLITHIVPGRYLFREVNKHDSHYIPHFEVPKFLSNAARRPEISALSYVEVYKDYHCDPVPLGLYSSPSSDVVWRDASEFTPNEVSKCMFPYNHGRAMIPTDLVMLGGHDVFVAPKVDGVSARVYVQRGVALMICDDKTLYKSICLDAKYDHDIQIQVEVVKDDGKIMRIVALDPYRIGIRSPTSFVERWTLFTHLYNSSVVLQQLFELQTYMPCTLDNFELIVSRVRSDPLYDGVVVQSCWAMPGSFKHGLGSARYLKGVYTVDVMVDGRILEVLLSSYLNGGLDVVRPRPDKKLANTYVQLSYLKVALSYSNWIDYLHLSTKVMTTMDVPVFTAAVLQQCSIVEVPLEERILVYRSRFVDASYLKGLLSTLSEYNRQIVYNIYMGFKSSILIELISEFQRSLRADDLSVTSMFNGVVVRPFDRLGFGDNNYASVPVPDSFMEQEEI